MSACLGLWLLFVGIVLFRETAADARISPARLLREGPSGLALLAPILTGAVLLGRALISASQRLRAASRKPRAALHAPATGAQVPWLSRLTAKPVLPPPLPHAVALRRTIALALLGLGLPALAVASCLEVSDRHVYAHRMYFEATVPAGLTPGMPREAAESHLRASEMAVTYDGQANRLTATSEEFPYGPCLLRVSVRADLDEASRVTRVSSQPGGSCL